LYELKRLQFAGPFPYTDQLYFPAPDDCVVRGTDEKCFALRPEAIPQHEGTSLPPSLQPVVLPVNDVTSFKYGQVPPWWSSQAYVDWLTLPNGPPPGYLGSGSHFLASPSRDERWHVEIDPSRLAAADERLFATSGLEMDFMKDTAGQLHRVRLAVRAAGEGLFATYLSSLNGLHTLGGERRLVHGQTPVGDGQRELEVAWACPQAIKDALASRTKVRMVLVSPAVFAEGWRPAWLTKTATGWMGSPPGSGSPPVGLRLVGMCNRRWQAVSGYSLEAGRVGPKVVRRGTPAGAVFFFEVVSGEAVDLARLWLRPVSDIMHRSHNGTSCEYDDGSDGFGLAVWGIW